MDNVLDNAVDEYEDNFEDDDDDQVENNNSSSSNQQQPSTPLISKETKTSRPKAGRKLTASEVLQGAANEVEQEDLALLQESAQLVRKDTNIDNIIKNNNNSNSNNELETFDSSSDEEEDVDDDNIDRIKRKEELNNQLFFACSHSDERECDHLIEKGAKVTSRDQHGWTPFHWASSKGSLQCLKILFQALGNSNSSNKDNNIDIKKRKRKYANCPDFITGWTPLHVAAIGAHTNCVEYLLEMGSELGRSNLMGETSGQCVPKGGFNGESGRKLAKLLGVELKSSNRGRGGDRSENEGKDNDDGEEKYSESKNNREESKR